MLVSLLQSLTVRLYCNYNYYNRNYEEDITKLDETVELL